MRICPRRRRLPGLVNATGRGTGNTSRTATHTAPPTASRSALEGGATLEAVNITEMRDGIYIAELVFGDDRVVSARPSDAVALAVRTGAPIFGADDLLDEVGIEIPDEQEDEVEKFREFLDQISPEDFGGPPPQG